jgi:two-component system, OmpR family, alkaline phosphatase synthesis response regulator PhoP
MTQAIIADNNGDNRTLCNLILSSVDGVEIISANSILESLALAKINRPDILIINVRLPDNSIFDICRKIKSDVNTSDISIILITRRINAFLEQKALEIGVDTILKSPWSKHQLLAAVLGVLHNRSKDQDE